MEENSTETLPELIKEILLLMEYNSPPDERGDLLPVLEQYSSDIIALRVFHHFYSYLPEAREDGITALHRLFASEGAFLLCARTLVDNYLFLATREGAEFLGPIHEGIWDPEAMTFFNCRTREEFLEKYREPDDFPIHKPLNESGDLCPVCGISDGEIHTFGCPVEICPWCDGQLTNCQCRFEKTGRDDLQRESHLDEFLEILNQQGRVPFNADKHRPALPDENDQ